MAITKGAALFAAVVCVMLATTAASQDLCLGSPCSPGGNCSVVNADTGPYAICLCDEDHLYNASGPSCEPLYDCPENTCGPDGKCRMTAGGSYKSCYCNPNYVLGTGPTSGQCVPLRCEADLPPCGPTGQCVNVGVAGIQCICDPGYYGDNCGDESEACDTDPCGEGGTCSVNSPSGYNCTCDPGYNLRSSHGGLQKCMKKKRSRRTGPRH